MFQNIDANTFKEKIERSDQAVILDVRTPGEYQEGHIPGAKNINIQDPDFMDQVDQLDEDKTYMIYCRSGQRSARACQIMASQGFQELYNLSGGILEWPGEVK